MRKVISALLIVALFLGIASPGYSQNMGKKLARGLVNIATGWLEIPKAIVDESKKRNIAVGLLWGPIKGTGLCVVRTMAGVYDTATFLFPIPANYEPVLRPEYVFSKEEVTV